MTKILVFKQPPKTQNLTVRIKSDLLQQARGAGVNLSKTLESLLEKEFPVYSCKDSTGKVTIESELEKKVDE